MNSCIQGSSIPVPIPTELYVSLLDYLSRSKTNCDEPATAVTTIIRKYLDDAQPNPPPGNNAASAFVQPNGAITLGAAVTAEPGKGARSTKRPNQPQSNDWCIGCGCPAEELIV